MPGFDGGLDSGSLRLREVKLSGGERESGIPYHALLARDHLAFQFDYLFFFRIQRDAILDDPDRANGTYVCALCAGSAGNGEPVFSVSEYSPLRAGIFKHGGLSIR